LVDHPFNAEAFTATAVELEHGPRVPAAEQHNDETNAFEWTGRPELRHGAAGGSCLAGAAESGGAASVASAATVTTASTEAEPTGLEGCRRLSLSPRIPL
jgi:hypothetical protein